MTNEKQFMKTHLQMSHEMTLTKALCLMSDPVSHDIVHTYPSTLYEINIV